MAVYFRLKSTTFLLRPLLAILELYSIIKLNHLSLTVTKNVRVVVCPG